MLLEQLISCWDRVTRANPNTSESQDTTETSDDQVMGEESRADPISTENAARGSFEAKVK
jgi:hypothetical protein